jgi:hypothetical protein
VKVKIRKTRRLIQVWSICKWFVTWEILQWLIVSTSPNSNLKEHPLSAVGEWLFNILRASFRRYDNTRRNIQRKCKFLPKFEPVPVEEFPECGAMHSGKNFRKCGSNVLDGYCCTFPRNVGRTAGGLGGFSHIQDSVNCFWRPWALKSWTIKLSFGKIIAIEVLDHAVRYKRKEKSFRRSQLLRPFLQAVTAVMCLPTWHKWNTENLVMCRQSGGFIETNI